MVTGSALQQAALVRAAAQRTGLAAFAVYVLDNPSRDKVCQALRAAARDGALSKGDDLLKKGLVNDGKCPRTQSDSDDSFFVPISTAGSST